jgi:polysaccharide biosynthesis protein PslG
VVLGALLLLAGCLTPPGGGGSGSGGSPPPSSPPPTSPPPARAVVGGFSDGSSILGRSGAELARELDAIAATGATYLRIDVYWAAIEQQRGVFHWGATDQIVDAARARRLEVLGIIDYSPAWARPPGTDDHHAPSNPADYANFAAAAVRRYAPRGVHDWELWNEPNVAHFWKPRPDPTAYAALLAAAYPAIKSADPGATVVTGGFSPAPDSADGRQIAPVTFLEGVYAAGGGGKFDAVGHHPSNYPYMPMRPEPTNYNWNAFGGVTPRLHQTMQAYGDGGKKIWGTEMGAPTPYEGMTVEYLAAYIREAYSAWANWPFTGPLIWYAYRDAGTNPSDIEDHFGVTYADLSPKEPAHTAIASILRGG